MQKRTGFTLIELLVVIAIIAILSVVVILTLNPAQLLQQSRDSNRISDMSTLNTALGIYLAQGGGSLGSSSIVYVSIPDSSATSSAGDQCQGLNLISLPSTYSYHCAASSTYRQTNGTGWIPINFNTLPTGSPVGSLPTDPINTTSSREYYTYTTNGTQYEVTMVPESAKYQIGGSNDVIASDGGTLASVYEKGNAYGLEPLDYGDNSLVGWWNFSEGTGTIVYDYSGNNATGSWSGTPVGTDGHYSAGKIGPYAGAFDGSTDYAEVPTSSPAINSVLKISGDITTLAWVRPPVSEPSYGGIINHRVTNGAMDYGMNVRTTGIDFSYHSGSGWYDMATGTMSLNAWHFIAVTRSNGGNSMTYYIDGVPVGSLTGVGTADSVTNPLVLGADLGQTQYFNGLIDDVRVYNRALSVSQIAAMYAGGK